MHGNHLVNHIKNNKLRGENTLHVIGVNSNPIRYQSRPRIAREWIKAMVKTKCVHLTVVEAAFGDRHFELIDDATELFDKVEDAVGKFICPPNFDTVEMRISSNSWIKESMMNLAVRRIVSKYPDAKYFAWIDMDVFFNDPNWAQETLHQLQYFQVVQPWKDAIDEDPYGGVFQHFRSFGYQHQRRLPKQKHPSQKAYQYAHSGFAWACTRKFVEAMWGAGGANGPWMDWPILGSADHHMAFAMIGETKDTIHGMMHPSFFRKCYEWENKAMSVTKGEVGFTPGRIEHKFHGPKGRRYYRERWQILVDKEYDPDKHLAHDEQGIAVITGNHKLEHAIYQYNLSRFEDSIEEV